jgi:hypothetical protein
MKVIIASLIISSFASSAFAVEKSYKEDLKEMNRILETNLSTSEKVDLCDQLHWNVRPQCRRGAIFGTEKKYPKTIVLTIKVR